MTPEMQVTILIFRIIIFTVVCLGAAYISLDLVWEGCPKFRKFVKRRIRHIRDNYYAAINADD